MTTAAEALIDNQPVDKGALRAVMGGYETTMGTLGTGVNTAQASADAAQTSASAAQTSANTAQASADAAQTSASAAQTSANTAQASADAAQAKADAAVPMDTVGQPSGVVALDGAGRAVAPSIRLPATAASFAVVNDSGAELFRVALGAGGLMVRDANGFSVLQADAGGLRASGLATMLSLDGRMRLQDKAGYSVFEADEGGVRVPGLVFRLSADGRLRVRDGVGNSVLEADETGLSTPAGLLSPGSGHNAFALRDRLGHCGILLPLTRGFDRAEIAHRDARAVAMSSLRQSAMATTRLARPMWGYNHFLSYGQSLSSGWEGWPALSTAAVAGNKMLGTCVRPLNETATAFAPVGDGTLHDLVATNQGNTSNGASGALLGAGAVAGLAAGDVSLGETPGEAALNFFRRRQLQLDGLSAQRLNVLSSCGVGGRTIEQLSKGAAPELFNRLRDAASQVKALATTAGVSYGVAALLFLQGEWNETNGFGGTTDKAGYKAKLLQLYADIAADLGAAIAAQAYPPALVTYQTGGAYTNDATGNAPGMAQLELAWENPGIIMAGPVYHVTDKGGHLDPNGYRWYGCKLGQVLHHTLTLNRRWLPLSPARDPDGTWRVFGRGREVLVEFHVPQPPLVFDSPYDALAPSSFVSRGFSAADAGGSVAITAVEISGLATVRILLARDPDPTTLTLTYAGKSVHNGAGMLRDSDPVTFDDTYAYSPGNGQYAGANIAALVGQPYPGGNWCAAFTVPVTPSI